ncbi:epidermal growth factor receptor kinase substrate 8-like protein 3 isoform X1 [Bufo gargarizans]|uniref:epidermal growth factor receptor kinase substrate 8-like protein 3 isoform X1 n=1 Tax=Bufo gargarizans TaxID=30331 RepID=UPI001CF553AC|nr:epidermal growth factor receptor kinase substrate 8-like protein 3 isoform X1 [Bufo gargarizans]XP_044142044.1 epidermal growth factor receptor kinase substrate 8-like protein 3 isoform X1 [Bufo gargarizans]XP_044142045.1 epidermal growth factor receptor kinase substrate 8-like protein 3 isoform X1 [Bufo gargarizans]XP_044142046.1 epidermal growth factor receptor kinase substrate 8-like protein 3 isoform X1 [Bufo gargarizans]
MDQNTLNDIEGGHEPHVESTKSSNVGSRPSAKSIYNQRKQYAQSLSKSDHIFRHRVEHLMTCELDNQLRNAQDCLKHLHLLDAEGKVWGQEMILQLQNGELVLTDLESGDSLESIPLKTIESCRSVMGGHPYNSLFVITVQNQENTSILLFQSDEHPASTLQKNLEKSLSERKADQQIKDNFRNKLQNTLTQNEFNERSYSPQQILSMDSPKLGRQTPQDTPVPERRYDPGPPILQPPLMTDQKADTARDIEVLNHVLTDIEIFVGKLNTDKKMKKAIPQSEFIECLQKIKYGFNLMAKVQDQMSQPTAPDLVHILMDNLPKILSKYPGKNAASSVLSPFLTQRAILLLSSCVTDKERKLWESLGDSWLRTREDWPNGKNVPPYIPTFYDGWIPPATIPSNGQPEIQESSKTPPTNRHFQPVQMKVAYDFEARNERELSVKKGDNVKVLDQSRQWWMVENSQKQRGFVPNNILESTNNNQQVPIQAVTLGQNSTPQEVTKWLQDKGFSRITVRCLGVLRGDQLLDLSRDDLKAVCPEEGGRVYSQLNELRLSLPMAKLMN